MSPTSFPTDDDISYHYLSWQEIGQLAEQLADKILAHHLHFNRLIALATGGLAMSRFLRDYLQIPKLSTMQVKFYTDINSRQSAPIITQPVPIDIDKENILIFDDINDTGQTLFYAQKYLKLRGAKKLTTATLLQKPHTHHPSDFFVASTTSWIIFPYEIRETINLLYNKWHAQYDLETIKKRFIQIGFTPKQIDTFLPQQ